MQEKLKVDVRWPAAIKFLREYKVNDTIAGDVSDVGFVLQGGMYNHVIAALRALGLADDFGNSRIPLHVLNCVYPLVPDELAASGTKYVDPRRRAENRSNNVLH